MLPALTLRYVTLLVLPFYKTTRFKDKSFSLGSLKTNFSQKGTLVNCMCVVL